MLQKLIRKRVLAKLWLKVGQFPGPFGQRRYHARRNSRLLTRTLNTFFQHNSPDRVRYYAKLVFQCWALNECQERAKISDEDFAEHLDQLTDLVSALHRYHLKMRFG